MDSPKRQNASKLEVASQRRIFGRLFFGDYSEVVLITLLVSIGGVVFFPSLFADFFWDDRLAILQRPAVIEPDGFLRAWIPFRNTEYWPVSYTFFWLLWRIAPNSAAVFHLAVVVTHLGCSILLWRLFLNLRVPLAYFGALLFLIHPINAETASWVRQLETTLSLLGGLASIYYWDLFLKKKNRDDALKSLLGFVFGVLSKTTVIAFPGILVLLSWYFGAFDGLVKSKQSVSLRNFWTLNVTRRLIPFLVVGAIMGVVSVLHNNFNSLPDGLTIRTDGFLERLQISGWALWFYLSKAILPIDLMFMYPRWSSDPTNILHWIPLFTYLVLLVFLWGGRERKGYRLLFLCLSAYAIALFPALGFVNIYFMRYSLVADHWQYQAVPIIIALMCCGLKASLIKLDTQKPLKVSTLFLVKSGILVWLLSWGYHSHLISKTFQKDETVYLETLKKNPGAWMVYNNLGNIYSDRKDWDMAIRFFRKSYEMNPGHIEAMTNEGKTLITIHRYQEAVALFDRAAKLAPNHSTIYPDWCGAYAMLGNYDLAEEKCLKALELSNAAINESSFNAYLNLTYVYRKTHRSPQAVDILQKLTKQFPENLLIRSKLAGALFEVGEARQAQLIAEAVLARNATDEQALEIVKKVRLKKE